MQTEITLSGYSDDIVILEITKDSKVLFSDEVSPGKWLQIEQYLFVMVDHTDLGWTHSIAYDSEAEFIDLDKLFSIKVTQDPENSYSPLMKITVNKETVVIAGIYGGDKTEFLNIVTKYLNYQDREEASKLYIELKKADLLK